MKIYFCDICNESIPLRDLETGAAITLKGKVICRTCNPASPARASAPSLGAGRAGAYAFASLVLALGGSLAFTTRFERARTEDRLAGLQANLQGLERRIREEVDRAQGSLAERIGAGERRLSEIAQGIEEGARLREKEAGELRTRFDRVQGYIRENEEMKRRLERLEIDQKALDENVARAASAVEAMRGEVRSLRESSARGAAPAAPAGAPVAEAEKPADALSAGVQSLLAKLKDPDPGVRWGAVTDLAQTADARIVPHLIPLLRDEDVFVRHNVALSLGDLDAKAAVPSLLDALADASAIVRDSAITALRRVTRQNFKFDPYGKKDERDRAVRAWRSWWESNGEKFLNS